MAARELADDPAVAAVLESAHAYDAMLAELGAPRSMRIPEGFTVQFTEAPDRAIGSASHIELGRAGRVFAVDPAAVPDVVAHEFAHGSVRRAGLWLESANEGWPDALAGVLAVRAGRADDAWVQGPGALRGADGTRVPVRDPRASDVPDVAAMDARFELAHRYVRSRFDPAVEAELRTALHHRPSTHFKGHPLVDYATDAHHFTALVTRPAALASAQLGAELVASAYGDAFVHRLAPAMREAHAVGRMRAAVRDDAPAITRASTFAPVLATGISTVDAATSLGGAAAGRRMREAWDEVGVVLPR